MVRDRQKCNRGGWNGARQKFLTEEEGTVWDRQKCITEEERYKTNRQVSNRGGRNGTRQTEMSNWGGGNGTRQTEVSNRGGRNGTRQSKCLTEKNFLHHVAVSIARSSWFVSVAVGIVFDTFWRAQVLQQRDAILSAEIHEFYVLHSVVKEHTFKTEETNVLSQRISLKTCKAHIYLHWYCKSF
jgi:hypothetical protein